MLHNDNTNIGRWSVDDSFTLCVNIFSFGDHIYIYIYIYIVRFSCRVLAIEYIITTEY